jgi:hypothetical protein
MKKQAQVSRARPEANRVQADKTDGQVPRRRISRMEQFNENFNKRIRSVFSTVDWGQVNHYMDRLT